MPLSPDDPFLLRVIDLGNNAISRIQAGTQRRLLEIYQLERDALVQRISRSSSQETFGARHKAFIVKALGEAIRRLETSLGQVHKKAIEDGAEAGAEGGIREIGGLEGRFGEVSIARSLASLVAVVPHRAIANVAALAKFETKNLTIEMDQTVRGFVQRALIQGRSSEQIVPELAKAIGEGLDQKRWQLERTLRTGLNAATNRGHNAGYLEARDILPELKRQAHEFLQAAQKIRGRGRVNHPFSFVVHGKVTELDAPWVVPSKEFPVMFWGRDSGQSAYIGMHYPAHLYDRGRQVRFRERWEGREGTMVRTLSMPSFEERSVPTQSRPAPPLSGRGHAGRRGPSPQKIEEMRSALGGALFIEDSDNDQVREHVADLARVPIGLLADLRKQGLIAIHVTASPITTRPGFTHLAGRRPLGRLKGPTWDVMAGGWNGDTIALSNLPGEGPSVALHEIGHAALDLLGIAGDLRVIEILAPLATRHPHLADLSVEDAIHELFATGFEYYFKLGKRETRKAFNQAFVDILVGMIQARSYG